MKPRNFRYCFEAHREDGMVCAIQVGKGKWRLTRDVACNVPTITQYYGRRAIPCFVVKGRGVVRFHRGLTTIQEL